MFAALKWDTPLPWEKKKSSMSEQDIANPAPTGLMDHMGPISLRKTTSGRSGSVPLSTKVGSNLLFSRALVPSAEQMMSNALIGSTASRYAVIKEKRTGFFLDSSQDILTTSDRISLSSNSSQDDSPGQSNTETNQNSLTRRNNVTVILTPPLLLIY